MRGLDIAPQVLPVPLLEAHVGGVCVHVPVLPGVVRVGEEPRAPRPQDAVNIGVCDLVARQGVGHEGRDVAVRGSLALAKAAAVTCAIIKPEFTPPFATKNGGSCDIWRSIIIEIRRSDKEPISAKAKAKLSAAIATVFNRASAVSSKKIPSPLTLKDFNPFKDDANKAPSGVVASGVVTSMLELFMVIDFELIPAKVVKLSEPPPSPIFKRKARPSCFAI